MATSLRELIVSVSADTSKYQREMDRAGRMGAQYFKSVKDGNSGAARAWNDNTSAARTHATAVEASAQAITRYAAVAAGAFGVSKLVGMADEWTNISARVRLATESTAEFERVQGRLKDIANTTYRSYAESADQFASTARMMRELGFETEATLDSTEALGLALVAGGSDAQRGASALDAWGKAIAQGKVGTEQWTTLLLQTPRVAQALADGLGKTTAQMTEMARAGELTARVAVPALISQMEALNAEVADMPTEFRDAIGRVNNELLAFVGGLNDTYDATGTLVKGLEFLVDNLDVVSKVVGGAAIGVLASKMILMAQATGQAALGMVQSRAAAIAETVAIRDATLAGQLKAQADLRRAQASMGAARGTAASATASRNYAAALLTERQATLAAAQAQAAYQRATSATAMAGRAALGVLGGPAGLAITIGMVAAGWLLFRDNADAAESALANWTGTADEAVAKFRELNAEMRGGALLELGRELTDLQGDLDSAFDKLLTAPRGTIGGSAWVEARDGIADLRREFAAGAIDADTLSARAAALAREMLDNAGATDRLGDTYTELLSSLAAAARQAEEKRGTIARLTTENDKLGSSANTTAGAIRGQAGAMVELGEEAKKAYEKIQNGLTSIPAQIERLGKSAGQVAGLDVRDTFRSMAKEGVDFSDRDNPQVRQAMADAEQYIRLQTELDTRQKTLAASTRELSKARKEAQASAADESLQELNQGYAQQVESLERQIALLGEVGRSAAMAYDLANGSLSGLAEAQKAYLQDMAEWLDDQDALNQVWQETAAEHAKYTEGSKKKLQGMEAYADQAARNMQTALGDSLYNVLDGKFSGIADSFSQMLKRMAAEMLASEIWQALGTALSGATGQGWWGTFARGVGGAMSGATDGGRAGGGQVNPWSAYDITEHGDPEILRMGGRQVLVTGSKGGVVSPLMQREGGGAPAARGEPGVKIEIINNSGGEVKHESSRAPDGSALERIIIGAVNKGFGGGEFDGAMGLFGARRQGAR